MADDQDQSQKTEEPSQKKLDDAHEKGEVAKSRDVNHWFMLLAITIAILVSGKSSSALLSQEFAGILGNAHGLSVTSGIEPLLVSLMTTSGVALGLPMLLLMGGALMGALVQHRPVFSVDKLQPKLEKISLAKGMKRLFSAPSWVELLKTILKFLIVGGVVTAILLPKSSLLVEFPSRSVETILPTIYTLTLQLLGGVLAVMAVLAGADYLFQVHQHRKQLRMTKQEVKDEFKQTDGDPMVKARLRQIRAERSRKRMMAAVPDADVVITNPTHFAVAMKYDHGKMEAPKVVAKGADHIAARIRSVAEEHKIPIVENPPLARALYASVEIDQEIPPEHYRGVAEVISFIMKLRRGTPGRR